MNSTDYAGDTKSIILSDNGQNMYGNKLRGISKCAAQCDKGKSAKIKQAVTNQRQTNPKPDLIKVYNF